MNFKNVVFHLKVDQVIRYTRIFARGQSILFATLGSQQGRPRLWRLSRNKIGNSEYCRVFATTPGTSQSRITFSY